MTRTPPRPVLPLTSFEVVLVAGTASPTAAEWAQAHRIEGSDAADVAYQVACVARWLPVLAWVRVPGERKAELFEVVRMVGGRP